MAELKDSTINGNPVWHAGNDGTGSGLDADTLDGQHASSFYSASNPPPNLIPAFTKYTYNIVSDTTSVSGADANSNTLSYATDSTNQLEVFVNGVKLVAGASNDYTATTGTSIAFTYTVPTGSVVDIQVFSLMSASAIQSQWTTSGSNIYYNTGNVGIGGTPTVSLDVGGRTDAIRIPVGTTAQRPPSPQVGMIRFNSELNYLEEYRTEQWRPLSDIFSATGGTELVSDGYKYHTFTTSGSFIVLGGQATAQVIVVAGGGAGGGSGGTDGSGGGGAGGVIYSSSVSLSAGAYSVIVGGGGAGVSTTLNGGSGSNSSFSGLTVAIGGGGGGAETIPPGYSIRTGYPGGSGGGGGGYSGVGGSGTSGQGNSGGNCTAPGDGGGGGAGGVGASGSTRHGGVGVQYSQFSAVAGSPSGWFGGGGGASGDPRIGSGAPGNGGTGGGGIGAYATSNSAAASSGVNGTGAGGGGAAGSTPVGSKKASGNGGSGIVIIRYAI